MKRVRIAVIGAGTRAEWGVLPVLSGPDIAAPPDTGAWWSRRADAGSSSEIRYQPPAIPEVVALCDSDRKRAVRVAAASRVRAVYSDWRVLLREVECDAIVCTDPRPEIAAEIALALPPNCRLWIDGLPSFSLERAQTLEMQLRSRIDKIWCARTLRQSAAHRAAQRLIERDQIGVPSALALRWGVPFAAPSSALSAAQIEASDDLGRLPSSYAALDLALSFVLLNRKSSTRTVANGQVWAREIGGATSVMLESESATAPGATATLLFAGAESWSAPLPRLEICGTQGRFLVCEAGRRLWLHHPREAARFWEPPGLSHHVSSANISGLAEDLKAFLAWCVAPEKESDALLNESNAGLHAAMTALWVLEAAARSLRDGQIATWSLPLSSTRLENAPAASSKNVSPIVQPTLMLPL